MANLQYITVPITTEPDELAQTAYDRIAELVEGWEPNDGNFEVIVIEAIATMMAEARDVASAVPLAIFRYFGQTVMKIAPINAQAATALTDWTFSDTNGHTIKQGTALVVYNEEGEGFAFEVTTEVAIAAGQSEAKGVPISAQVPGAASSGLSGKVEQVSGLSYVSQIILSPGTTATGGGTDEETDTEYLNRLASELSLLAPRPITTKDYSLIATNIDGVHRALALNGYNPESKTFGNERTVSVAAIDTEGNAVPETIRNELKKYLESVREVNFLPFVISPTYTEVDVEITVHAAEGSSKTVIEEAVRNAIKNFLEPRNWGMGPAGTGGGGVPIWRNEPAVRQGSIAAVANANVGVTYPLLPTMALHGSILKPEDVVLPGAAPLPRPGNITVNVVIP